MPAMPRYDALQGGAGGGAMLAALAQQPRGVRYRDNGRRDRGGRSSNGVSGDRGLGRPQSFKSSEGTLGAWSTEAPDDFDWSGDADGRYPVSRLRTQYLDYLSAKQLEIEEQKQSRHYYHGAQWTPDEIRILRARRQPVVTFNRTGRKIDSIIGMIERMRQDPKAYPRNPKNSDGAEVATQAIRSVLDSNDWEYIDPVCGGQAATEGIAGIELKLVDGDHDDPDVKMEFVFGDDFFYDPRSFKADFSDARYMGIAKWLDVEEAIELFPDKEYELRTMLVESGFDLTTHSDREFKWIYVNEKRIRLVEHWYKHRGKWMWAFYVSNVLLDEGVSPFLDERNKPMNRFVMFSAWVDHDGDRYGFPRNLKGPQDELNQRRSKSLHMSNVTRLIGTKGAVDNVEQTRREYARPDGYVEVNPGFEAPKADDKTADLQHQLLLMQDARQEIDSYANVTPDLITRDVKGEHSGVAINLLQRAGIAELGPFLRNYKAWKKRVYRAVWNVLSRYWQGERWLRVMDNEKIAQFLQVNGEEEDEWGRPVIINALGNISVEIVLDDGPDAMTVMQDAYDVIKDDPTVPFAVKLIFMPIPESKKDQVRKAMQQQPDPQQQAAVGLELQEKQAKIADLEAQSAERHARSVTHVARAAHLAHESNMDVATFVREGFQAALTDQTPGAPTGQPTGTPARPQGAAPGPSAPQGAPMQQPPGFMQQQGGSMQPPTEQQFGPVVVPMHHPVLKTARRGADGKHYIPDPRRPGKFLMVA